MIENELKRIADALEAIAIAMQPVRLASETVDTAPEQEAPVKKAKAKPAPAHLVVTPEQQADPAPAGDKAWTTDEIVEMVQKAVKINRNATLEVCKKYGYEKSLKEIDAAKYPELAEALATIKG